ncbi:hypothetical protein [Proteiniborus sp. MB09-C3]|uniref:hypothetical protein n=1 Tax=Proteiniborus sp. MB09-C3 TaxID=3050072 RepID=UPI0025552309|nr:hypothetical protein [Proteiniborus sp. MB09-C3]WIV13307.1 hypothetical protein QO263_06240 [Proteiniborus sp. MB09-C3]
MEDNRTIQEIINQLNMIEKDHQHILEHVNSIDLLMVSNENGRVKDSNVAKKIDGLKQKIEDVVETSNEITSMLNRHI